MKSSPLTWQMWMMMCSLLLTGILISWFGEHLRHPPPTEYSGEAQHWPDYHYSRSQMVHYSLESRGLHDERLLRALGTVPRHLFVPTEDRGRAYQDVSLDLGGGCILPPPSAIGLILETAAIRPGAKVLVVGTARGYEAALVAAMGARAYATEPTTAERDYAATRLRVLGFDQVKNTAAPLGQGWPQAAPFDVIVSTQVVGHDLRNQLARQGRLVAPIFWDNQPFLTVIDREGNRYEEVQMAPYRLTAQQAGILPPAAH